MEISEKTTIEIVLRSNDISKIITEYFLEKQGIKITNCADIPSGRYVFNGEKTQSYSSVAEKPIMEFIKELNISVRCYNSLLAFISKKEFTTVDQLLNSSPYEIRKVQKYGQKSHSDLIEELHKKGITDAYKIFEWLKS